MLSRISNSQAPLLDVGVICAVASVTTFIGVVAAHALNHLVNSLSAGQFIAVRSAILVTGTPLFLGIAKVALIAAAIFIALHFLKEGVQAIRQ